MEKRRNRGASCLQFSKEEQMQAVRAGQPESSHSPLLHQGIHAAHVQLHHQAAEANEDENSAVQAALTADDMQEEAFRAAAHAGKAPKRHNARWQQKRAIRQEYAAAKSSRRPANRTAPAPKAAANAVPKAENIKKRLRQTFARHPTAWAVLALAALLLAVMSSLQSCTPLAQSVLESIVIGTYPAEEADVKAAESAYAGMERQLKEEMSNYARNHPEYDEVQVDADEIWHDPYVLIAIISACFDGQDWTLETAMPVLDKYFKLQYIVTESVTRETRYRMETEQRYNPETERMETVTVRVPYAYTVCHVRLENKNLSHLPVVSMSHHTMGMYALYMRRTATWRVFSTAILTLSRSKTPCCTTFPTRRSQAVRLSPHSWRRRKNTSAIRMSGAVHRPKPVLTVRVLSAMYSPIPAYTIREGWAQRDCGACAGTFRQHRQNRATWCSLKARWATAWMALRTAAFMPAMA